MKIANQFHVYVAPPGTNSVKGHLPRLHGTHKDQPTAPLVSHTKVILPLPHSCHPLPSDWVTHLGPGQGHTYAHNAIVINNVDNQL